MPRNCLIILLDGAADRAHPGLDGRTPLQAAATPFLDSLARQGSVWLHHPTDPGQPLPVESALYPLLGMGAHHAPSLGVLSALGSGMDLAQGDVVFSARLASVEREEDGALVLIDEDPSSTDEPDEAAHACTGEACADLFRSLEPATLRGVEFQLVHTEGLDGALILRGAADERVTDVDPLAEGLPLARPMALDGAPMIAEETARALGEYLARAHSTLSGLEFNRLREERDEPPVNALLTRAGGRQTPSLSFLNRFCMEGGLVSPLAALGGAARDMGLAFRHDPDRGEAGEDLARRLGWARELFEQGTRVVVVHSRACFRAARAKSPGRKKRALESLDAALAENLPSMTVAGRRPLVGIAAGPGAPASGRLIRTGEPYPVLLHGPGVRCCAGTSFQESEARALLRSTEFFALLLDLLDRSRLAGWRETPVPAWAWPAPYEPFRVD
ncbi:hypothetical protein [Desulfohalovibrio reitneri]|uniref:hypothetical protein n=1 Tax=Desulfohalovibrio reitneri TaxID=1307759 RepID=UPI0004A6AC3D|nr:hypothetical protein [Desulfohalovibrio reitneri]